MFVCAETKYEWQSKGGGRSGGVFDVSETTDGLFETLQKPARWDHPAASSITGASQCDPVPPDFRVRQFF